MKLPDGLGEIDMFMHDLKLVCLHLAGVDLPEAGVPIDDAWSREADEYCRRLARLEYEDPSPEVAVALFPRLTFALHFRTRMKGPPDGASPLEYLLVTLWHQQWKARWLAGDFGEHVDDSEPPGDPPQRGRE
jgi:hypothetical protein